MDGNMRSETANAWGEAEDLVPKRAGASVEWQRVLCSREEKRSMGKISKERESDPPGSPSSPPCLAWSCAAFWRQRTRPPRCDGESSPGSWCRRRKYHFGRRHSYAKQKTHRLDAWRHEWPNKDVVQKLSYRVKCQFDWAQIEHAVSKKANWQFHDEYLSEALKYRSDDVMRYGMSHTRHDLQRSKGPDIEIWDIKSNDKTDIYI